MIVIKITSFAWEDIRRVQITNGDLLQKLEELDKFSEQDKATIKAVLDTFILNNRFQKPRFGFGRENLSDVMSATIKKPETRLGLSCSQSLPTVWRVVPLVLRTQATSCLGHPCPAAKISKS